MADDWRLRVQMEAESSARDLVSRLNGADLEHDLRDSFHDRVVVSRDRETVFCYANSREQADAAKRAIQAIASGMSAEQLDAALERWHPEAERWEPAEAHLPGTDAERAQEHAELIERERRESRDQGFPMFEVRVSCASRSAAERLSEQLSAEGIQTVHRWEFVVAGAEDEDAASALGERIRRESPEGTTVTVEGSVQEIAQDAPYATPFSPFAVFGGLAG